MSRVDERRHVHGGADRVLRKLYELVRQQRSVTISIDPDLVDELGRVDFSTHTISLAADLTDGEFRSTLTHEIVHLLRGPVPAPRQNLEELMVERETATILIPEVERAGFARRRRTPAEISSLAQRYQVDEQLVMDQCLPPRLTEGDWFWFRET